MITLFVYLVACLALGLLTRRFTGRTRALLFATSAGVVLFLYLT